MTTSTDTGAAAAPPRPDFPSPLLPPGVELTFDRTVPRDIAHRRQIGEVFVADSAQVGEDDFCLSFQVPRAHSLWSDQWDAYHDPFASAEAARQAIFVLLHRHVGVAVGLPFSLQRISFRIEDVEAYRNDHAWPLQGYLRYRVAGRRNRGSDVVGMTLEGAMEIGGRPAMTLSAELAFMSQQDYDVFRAFQRAQKPVATATTSPRRPLDPALVGRSNPRNVVIGAPGEHTTGPEGPLLAADRRHPAFFDHEYDHVPGPLIAEGLRQAALVAACRAGAVPSPHAVAVGCEAAFLDFGEFEADLTYTATVGDPAADGRVPVEVGLHQFGKAIVTGRIDLLPETRTTAHAHPHAHGV
ncbi:AfsA-related hotdog domain-containing protein [Streptomyces cucumeris]|uniref:AfsA-related hotdog domain-containing protein n=1 Tax=Streptomyces cucumeris TaxID=2962890 RepID=UPI003D73A27E